jgi:hypothetical protein
MHVPLTRPDCYGASAPPRGQQTATSLPTTRLAVWRPGVPGGALVLSIHHPITGWQLSGKADCHRTELVSEQYDYDGQLVTVQMYRRPVSAIFRQLRGAGFTVDVVDEPQPETAGAQ